MRVDSFIEDMQKIMIYYFMNLAKVHILQIEGIEGDIRAHISRSCTARKFEGYDASKS